MLRELYANKKYGGVLRQAPSRIARSGYHEHDRHEHARHEHDRHEQHEHARHERTCSDKSLRQALRIQPRPLSNKKPRRRLSRVGCRYRGGGSSSYCDDVILEGGHRRRFRGRGGRRRRRRFRGRPGTHDRKEEEVRKTLQPPQLAPVRSSLTHTRAGAPLFFCRWRL